jgi:peptidoglycan/xylan/chitin deacetylase (PgdA/CDA1 family)
MTNLWTANQPGSFWQCQPNPPDEVWQDVIKKALPALGLTNAQSDMDTVLALTLGEGRFGSDHWKLGPLTRIYYLVKFIIPRSITLQLRRLYNRRLKTEGIWPIESRYANFLWEVLRQVLMLNDSKELTIKGFWPDHNRFAFVLTHDIETAAGQEFVEVVADLEENLGFRSLFNFVPESYKLNYKLMDDLRQRGFEVGIHGLKHDGNLFVSKPAFMQKASRINQYLKEWNAVGFRAELTIRQPEWMQALEIEYDLSFFDTDPFEPIPGGTMSIWPFFTGHFVELPYTLVQDYTLTSILGEISPRIWLEKVEFIEEHHGMALVNTHPDYLKSKPTWDVYEQFLTAMKKHDCYWHGLPGEVAKWWKSRLVSSEIADPVVLFSKVLLEGGNIRIEE